MKKDLSHYQRYGWRVNETNLQTLPETAPKAAQDLAQWLTLEGRRSTLEEWIGCCSEDDSRIHGKFWHIGAWTHRMAHTNPNQANPPSVFHGEPKTAVEHVKAKYDGRFRSLLHVPEGSYLVGCDAEGIQLRILAHYMKSDEYVKAIVEGRKEDETDIHNVNKRALGSLCKSRDDAKTFIYSFLLGASVAKTAEVLGCTIPQASGAVESFLTALPELRRVKKVLVPRDAGRGYFTGLDGRKVPCNSEHLMLSGYLQNGESVVMKKATVQWKKDLKGDMINYKLCDLVHDEWQTQVDGTYEEAEHVGKVQAESLRKVGEELGVYCPLAGSYDIGKSWLDTH